MSNPVWKRPVVVVGVGSFGADACARLSQVGLGGEASRQPVLRWGLDGADLERELDELISVCEPLLGLDSALRGEHDDARRPSLEVYFVASFGEAEVAGSLPRVVESAGRALLERFSNIFPGHDAPNLGLYPIVALLGVRGRSAATHDIGQALGELERVARSMSFRGGPGSPVSRIFVIEQQTSRYELLPSELLSTVTAWLSLALGSDLCEREPIRSFLRSTPEHLRDGRLFASFGSATLELAVESSAVPQAVSEVLEELRQSSSEEDVATRTEDLVPEVDALVSSLESPSAGDDLVARLRAELPSIEFPPIEPWHTPEHVERLAYGPSFFDSLESRVRACVERLEATTMPGVARSADERGLRIARRQLDTVARAVHGAELPDHRGFRVALRLAEGVAELAESRAAALAGALARESLPERPKTAQVESALESLREEAQRRPRPERALPFAALFGLTLALLLHPIPRWLHVVLVQRRMPSATHEAWAGELGGVAGMLLDPPGAILWLGLLGFSVTYLWLRRHRERRGRALEARRVALRSAVRRYLEDQTTPSLARYYESRLRFLSRSWAMRILQRLAERASSEAERLGRVAKGLDRAIRSFAAEAERAARPGEAAGDLVYHRRVDEALYSELSKHRPHGAALAQGVLAELSEELPPGDVPGFLFADRLREAVAPHASPPPEVLSRVLGSAVVQFVAERHAKLDVPLELSFEGQAGASVQRFVFAPSWALDALREASARFVGLPAPEPHGDTDRVHLLAVRVGLDRSQIHVGGPRQESAR